ncbi:MAG TPA: CehA/McbA family metallohydrolase, partial [Polyangiaceae bacterium]|nr:CehA/McbA family metallohydrolase [Polyangiaceae bacterium]
QPMHLSVTSALARAGRPADLQFVLGPSSIAIWHVLAEIAAVPTAPVRGRVTGTSGPSLIFGRDAQDNPQVRARVGDTGTFALDVPTSVVKWYAAIDPGRASSLTWFTPGTPRDLLLDISPGGELRVKIVDADTNEALTARLLVHGTDGTVDPSFGPDYRASGAGPVVDALRGEVTTPLPSGHYRVSATKGIEWSIDESDIEIGPGTVSEVVLRPRHVVPTPGVLGCDLHVHARPSFDTPVTPEDRVLSLAAAGVDFAVPTEHNVVGDYSSALETLDLGRELLSVPGVEVTTIGKGFGHFGVFPFPTAAPVPPFRHTTMAAIFRAVRAGDPARYFQLNHPRLPRGIGYFNKIAFDPNAPREGIRSRIDFDGIEVYNGYDTEVPDRVEQVMRDYWALLNFGWRYVATGSSDSHRIQFHWAGYPRTMVTVDPDATLESDVPPVNPLVVVANVKKGHAVVTSGPMIEFQLAGAHPGDEVVTEDDPLHGHVRVRAAPWIDVTRVEVVVGTVGGSCKTLQSFAVAPREVQVGQESGTLEEAQDRTIRLDRDLEAPVGPGNGWVQVIARGDRRMDDVLPFMPVPPLAFTNPVYVVRHPVPPPAFPGVDGGLR